MNTELKNDVMGNVEQVFESADEFMEVIPRKSVAGKVAGGAVLITALVGTGVYIYKKKFAGKKNQETDENVEDFDLVDEESEK